MIVINWGNGIIENDGREILGIGAIINNSLYITEEEIADHFIPEIIGEIKDELAGAEEEIDKTDNVINEIKKMTGDLIDMIESKISNIDNNLECNELTDTLANELEDILKTANALWETI